MLAAEAVEVTDNIMVQEDQEAEAMEALTEDLVEEIEVLAEVEDITHQIITAAMADQVSLL
jgi:hypothetical protein